MSHRGSTVGGTSVSPMFLHTYVNIEYKNLAKMLPDGLYVVPQVELPTGADPGRSPHRTPDAGRKRSASALSHQPVWNGLLFIHRSSDARPTPYAGACYRFIVSFPNRYPHQCPVIRFIDEVFHPLVSDYGQVNIWPEYQKLVEHSKQQQGGRSSSSLMKSNVVLHLLHYLKLMFYRQIDDIPEKDCEKYNPSCYEMYKQNRHDWVREVKKNVRESQSNILRDPDPEAPGAAKWRMMSGESIENLQKVVGNIRAEDKLMEVLQHKYGSSDKGNDPSRNESFMGWLEKVYKDVFKL